MMIEVTSVNEEILAGRSVIDIAEEYDFPVSEVRKLGRDALIKTGKIWNSASILSEEVEWVRTHREEMTYAEMAEFLGRSEHSVRDIVNKWNLNPTIELIRKKRMEAKARAEATDKERRENQRAAYRAHREQEMREYRERKARSAEHHTDAMGGECGNWEWLKRTYTTYQPNNL